jgi:N-acetylmuramoyl-L-alanine amidase
MRPGAVGRTDFPANDPPPGKLKEDDLTMAIAREAQRLMAPKYKVILTKGSAQECPSFLERGEIAKRFKAKVLVSIHINAPNPIPGDLFGNGTSVLYNSSKPDSKPLADSMSGTVSSNLGVNNRGSMVRDDLAILKPTVTVMNAVLLEAARLSGDDEKVLHAAGSSTRIAIGIKSALDAYLGN